MRILQTINVPTTHKKHFQTNIAFSYQKDVELTPRLAARHEETKNATLTDCVFLNGGADEVRTHDL